MVRNWGKEEGGTFPVFAQDHGAGKTFMIRHLAAFLGKPLGEDDVPIQLTDSTSKLALASTTLEFVVTAKKPTLTTLDFMKGDIRPFSHSLPHLHRMDQLTHVRTIEISWSDLTKACHDKFLRDAILVAAAAKILGRDVGDKSLYEELQSAGVVNLQELCKLLTEDNGAVLLLLDDFVKLAYNPSSDVVNLFGMLPTADTAFTTLEFCMYDVLRLPGVAVALTGRAPDNLYDKLHDRSSQTLVRNIVLGALSKTDIMNIICKSKSNSKRTVEVGEERFLRDVLNLCNDIDVQDLASRLHQCTGGQGIVVECTLEALESDPVFMHYGRLSVAKVLTDAFMNDLFQKHIEPFKLFPGSHRVPSAWDMQITMYSLLSILHEAQLKGSVPAKSYMYIHDDQHVHDQLMVTAEELLAVMGVPFHIDKKTRVLNIQMSTWLIRSLSNEVSLLSPKAKMMLDEVIHHKSGSQVEEKVVSAFVQVFLAICIVGAGVWASLRKGAAIKNVEAPDAATGTTIVEKRLK